LVIEQVLQNALHFAVLSGSCSETAVSEQPYSVMPTNKERLCIGAVLLPLLSFGVVILIGLKKAKAQPCI
jgi:hypothetical protein